MIRCDNCGKKTKEICILHQLKFPNLPETYYFCECCCSMVISTNTELNSKLEECLTWIFLNSYIEPGIFNAFIIS